jgi:single stranded DNA-binding protein
MQKILLIGYLGRDPEVKYSQQGTAVAQFSLATNERWKDKSGQLQEHTEWFAIKAFGRRAEVVGDYLHKGSRVYLEGRKRTESWDDKQTGVSTIAILCTPTKLSFSIPRTMATDLATGSLRKLPATTSRSRTTSRSKIGVSVRVHFRINGKDEAHRDLRLPTGSAHATGDCRAFK